MFNFEPLDMLWAWHRYPSQKSWPFQFAESFLVQIRASRYMTDLNHTHEWKVMAIWICLLFPCSISSISMYYGSESEIRVKIYDRLNFLRASVVKFRALDISWASIIHRVKSYGRFEFAESFLVQIWAPGYIVGVNRTFESKVITIWIFLVHPCVISSSSIYYALESDIRVKSYDNLNFLRPSFVQFHVFRYIKGLNLINKSKVKAIWICQEFFFLKFERLDMLLAWIEHLSQKIWSFEFAIHFLFNFERLDILCA